MFASKARRELRAAVYHCFSRFHVTKRTHHVLLSDGVCAAAAGRQLSQPRSQCCKHTRSPACSSTATAAATPCTSATTCFAANCAAARAAGAQGAGGRAVVAHTAAAGKPRAICGRSPRPFSLPGQHKRQRQSGERSELGRMCMQQLALQQAAGHARQKHRFHNPACTGCRYALACTRVGIGLCQARRCVAGSRVACP